jgi:hypothetical protein
MGAARGLDGPRCPPIPLKALVVATNPAREAEFRAMEPSNKWGTLESVVRVLRGFIVACENTLML